MRQAELKIDLPEGFVLTVTASAADWEQAARKARSFLSALLQVRASYLQVRKAEHAVYMAKYWVD
jgi:hypothetical protein